MIRFVEVSTGPGCATYVLGALHIELRLEARTVDGNGRHCSNQPHGRLYVVAQSDDAPEELELHFLGLRMDPHRIVYGTIILMTAFALYDGSITHGDFGTRPFLTLAGVVIAPLFALSMAHTFSEALDMHIRLKRNLSAHDRRHLLAANMQYLYLAIPPLLIVLVLRILGVEAGTVINVVQLVGALSLFGWGFFAGRKAEVTVGRQLLMGLGYMFAGIVVIVIELVLTH